MAPSINLDVSQQAVNARTLPPSIVDTSIKISSSRSGALVARSPSREPIGNRRERSTTSGTSRIVWNRLVASSVSLKHWQRRASRVAVVVPSDVGVKGSRDGSKGSKLAAVVRAASKSIDKATAVGVANGVHAGLVNTVVVLDPVDKVGREHLVTDAGGRVGWSLPVSL